MSDKKKPEIALEEKIPGLKRIAAISIGAIALMIMATGIYAPAMPQIVDYFQTTTNMIQYTIAANLLGIALSGLIYGPLSDYFGRRPITLFGYLIFVLAAFACAHAPSAEWMIFFRFLQGCGAGAGSVTASAMIKDKVGGVQLAKIFSGMSIIIVLAPAASPIIGGYLTETFNWQATFYFISGIGAIFWLLSLWSLPETLDQDKRTPLTLRGALTSYAKLLQNRTFSFAVLLSTILFCGMYCYITVAPFVFIQVLGISVKSYGYYVSLVVLFHVLGSLYTKFFVSRIGLNNVLLHGLILSVLGGSLLFTASHLYPHPVLLALLAGIYSTGIPITISAGSTMALDQSRGSSGAAASILGSSRMAMAFVGSTVGGFIHDVSLAPAAIFMTLLAIFPLTIFRRFLPKNI